MVKFVKGALLTATVSLALGGIASAQPLNATEFKCQTGVSKAGSKFVGSKAKCAIKCQGNAQKGVIPDNTGCYGPAYTDPATNTCIFDSLKGAEAKFQAAIIKACTLDCPECYSGGDCSAAGEAGDRVQNIEGQVDSFGPGVFCLAAPTKEELACESNTAKVLAKLTASLNKCFDKCNGNMFKLKIPAGSCNPPPGGPADSATGLCISTAQSKAIAGVDKKCSVAGAIAVPDCNGDTTDDYPVGNSWTNLVTSAIAGNVPGTYCASPSGAFIQ